MWQTPVKEYRTIIGDSGNPGYVNRILIGVPVTGLVRIEWVQARYGQLIPVNWSQVEVFQFIDAFMPYRYQVDDAQNLIAKIGIEKDFEWLLLYEHDVLPPPDAFMRLNRYMRDGQYPIVSGLYFSRSRPSDPLVFRGRGNGSFNRWHWGDKIWVDGVPTGFLLIHMSIIKAMWEDSEAQTLGVSGEPVVVRRVFNTPRDQWVDPEQGWYNTTSGTSDLAWSSRIIEGGYLEKAGWGEYLKNVPDPQLPFMIDSELFCKHINPDGTTFPLPVEMKEFEAEPAPPDLGIDVTDGVGMGEVIGG